jgi:hypothetical protein
VVQRLMQGFPVDVQYHIELLAPATNAFVPDAEPTLSPRKVKATATGSEEGKKREHVYLSKSVEVATNSRRDEPSSILLVWGADRLSNASCTATPQHEAVLEQFFNGSAPYQ